MMSCKVSPLTTPNPCVISLLIAAVVVRVDLQEDLLVLSFLTDKYPAVEADSLVSGCNLFPFSVCVCVCVCVCC